MTPMRGVACIQFENCIQGLGQSADKLVQKSSDCEIRKVGPKVILARKVNTLQTRSELGL